MGVFSILSLRPFLTCTGNGCSPPWKAPANVTEWTRDLALAARTQQNGRGMGGRTDVHFSGSARTDVHFPTSILQAVFVHFPRENGRFGTSIFQHRHFLSIFLGKMDVSALSSQRRLFVHFPRDNGRFGTFLPTTSILQAFFVHFPRKNGRFGTFPPPYQTDAKWTRASRSKALSLRK